MALPMSSLNAFLTIPRLPPSQIGISLKANFSSYSILPCSISRLSICRNHTDSSTTPLLKEEEPVVLEKDKDEKKDLLKEAFEAFFGDDLENDDSLIEDDDDDISDEELVKLERELEEAFKNYDEEYIIDSTDNEGDGDDDDDEELLSNLTNWQLHRLAYALKDESRKTNIKDLADDLCLDQTVVLKLLSDPVLLLMTAALPDNLDSTILDPPEHASTVSDIETYTPESYAYEEIQMPLNSEDEDVIIEEVTQID